MTQALLRGVEDFIGFPAYAASGHLLYQRGRAFATEIWAIPFDLETLQPPVGEQILIAENGLLPTLANDGTLVYRTGSGPRGQQLVWVNRKGRIEGSIGAALSQIIHPAIAADGQRVAMSGVEERRYGIWLHEFLRQTFFKLNLPPDLRRQMHPSWSADGNQLAFTAYQDGI